MRHTRLGGSGLTVSRIALGCMSFGDTANVYRYGSSEGIVGRAIRRCTRREEEREMFGSPAARGPRPAARGVPMAQLDEAGPTHLVDLARAAGTSPARVRRRPTELQVRPSVDALTVLAGRAATQERAADVAVPADGR